MPEPTVKVRMEENEMNNQMLCAKRGTFGCVTLMRPDLCWSYALSAIEEK